jgi:hypothetical protein
MCVVACIERDLRDKRTAYKVLVLRLFETLALLI